MAAAQAMMLAEWLLLKGSTASRQDVASWDTYRSQRDDLVEQGMLVPIPDHDDIYRFTENVPFSSPSAAGTVICARNTNGRTAWKTSSGQTYADWQDARQQASEDGATK
ncbi:MAG: DUF4357 domain-containing protein [Planctomycetota bacterium]|jgi:hypothetical protein|nr:DUF4357 domain-containing protein [Planctomycetota bacterium]